VSRRIGRVERHGTRQHAGSAIEVTDLLQREPMELQYAGVVGVMGEVTAVDRIGPLKLALLMVLDGLADSLAHQAGGPINATLFAFLVAGLAFRLQGLGTAHEPTPV